MRRCIIALACGCGAPIPPPRLPAPVRLCAATHDLTLATAPPRDDATDSTVPRRYRLADGRTLAVDRHHDTMAIDGVELGHAQPLDVAGGALVITGHDGVTIVSDIDPHAPRLRELLRTAEYPEPIGALDGAIAFRIGHDLVCLSGPGEVVRITRTFADEQRIATADAIRGRRVLVVVGTAIREATMLQPFRVPVQILDLDTRTSRVLGDAHGGWTRNTNVPAPRTKVVWSDDSNAYPATAFDQDDAPISIVDVHTEALGDR